MPVIAILSAPLQSMAQQIDVAAAQKRFQDLYAAGDYAAALAEAQKTEAAAKRGGTNNFTYVSALNDLARAHQALGRYGEAAAMFKQVLGTLQRNLPPTDPRLAQPLANLATVYLLQANPGEAEKLYKRALDISTKAQGGPNQSVALLMSNLADVYKAQARYDEAEAQYKRALDMAEKTAGPSSLLVALILNNLTKVYEDQSRFHEVEDASRRALAIREKALGPNHPDVAASVNNLAHVYERLGRYAEADKLFQRSIEIWEKALGPKHPYLATSLLNLASVYADEDRFDEAEALYKRALGIREAAFGPNHSDVATVLNNLAAIYEAQGRSDELETLCQTGARHRHEDPRPEQSRHRQGDPQARRGLRCAGPLRRCGRPVQARARHRHQGVRPGTPLHRHGAAESGTAVRAPAPLRRCRASLQAGACHQRESARPQPSGHGANAQPSCGVERRAKQARQRPRLFAQGDGGGARACQSRRPSGRQARDGDGLIEQRSGFFVNHVASLAAGTRGGVEPAPALAREAFEIAQWANQSSAAAAVQQLSPRFASGNDALAALVRQDQDLSAYRRDREKALVEMLAKPAGQSNPAQIDSIRRQIEDTERKLAATRARLEKEFPDYAALSNPRPLKVEDVQKLLGRFEALVLLLTGEEQSYVFAVTADGFDWRTIPAGRDDIAAKVTAFRRGLELDTMQLFDLKLANELYTLLLGPVDALVKDKGHLLVAPSGVLTALPFHLLVTEKPATSDPQGRDLTAAEDAARYRDAAWLIKRQAVSTLPSVASLQALRSPAQAKEGAKPMIGFGDPVFDPRAAPDGGPQTLAIQG